MDEKIVPVDGACPILNESATIGDLSYVFSQSFVKTQMPDFIRNLLIDGGCISKLSRALETKSHIYTAY